jgi:hypothetical protein
MPSLISGFVLRPRSTAMRMRSPTPPSSIVSNGLRSGTVLEIEGQELPSASSRDMPSVVCVRSFVPKEEVRNLGDLVGCSGARQLDHRPQSGEPRARPPSRAR